MVAGHRRPDFSHWLPDTAWVKLAGAGTKYTRVYFGHIYMFVPVELSEVQHTNSSGPYLLAPPFKPNSF